MIQNRWHVPIIQLLAVVGLLVASYLWLVHNGDVVAACSGSGWDNCGVVSGPTGRFAAIGPVSVAAIGVAGYSLIFLLTWLPAIYPPINKQLPEILLGTISSAFLFSMLLTGVELFVLHAFCRYCVLSALIVTIMFVVALIHMRKASSAAP